MRPCLFVCAQTRLTLSVSFPSAAHCNQTEPWVCMLPYGVLLKNKKTKKRSVHSVNYPVLTSMCIALNTLLSLNSHWWTVVTVYRAINYLLGS